ncbi:T9SS C-terminal target domain-containing protein [Chitinophaga lutea]|uniref:T9SS C-terminal target domain-containing protein n=1 Tax=Chitinophaga lutea TaxID=2488634 RepID=A0A3N4Q039_9BACT|nr:T9SS type A sorting domain-containing protein [Chitinophaga lutea]RPE12539.1 T9SS C-terminal target domain-containing protein [Chitinophaga lutea]
MKRTVHVILYVLFVSNCFAQSFIPGNFVVLRIGSGADTLTAGVAQPVFLDEYNPCGDLVRSIAMPVTVSGDHKRLTLPISTTDYTEGYLSRSQDGSKLALAGYDADPGTTGVSSISSTTVKRVVGVVNTDGTVNTSTALSAFSGQAVRAAVIDGSGIWVSGGSGGIMYTTPGGTSHVQLTNATARSLVVSNGQLYASSTSGSYRLTTVGTGLPVTAGQTMVNLPGLPATGSPYQFLIVNAGSGSDVLYLAHDNLLRKYSLSGGAWVSNGAIGVASDKYRAVTGTLHTNGTVLLYAIRRNDNATAAGGEIVTLTDSTGYNSDFSAAVPTVIVRANEQNVFRSVVMAPEGVAVNTLARKGDTDSISLKLSPNGARENVVVTFNTTQLSNPSIVLTNAAGQVVRRIAPASIQAGKVTINVQGLAKGVYYVTLNDGKKQTTKKLLVL